MAMLRSTRIYYQGLPKDIYRQNQPLLFTTGGHGYDKKTLQELSLGDLCLSLGGTTGVTSQKNPMKISVAFSGF